MAESKRLYEILLIEDNPADAAIVRQLLSECEPGDCCNVRWIMHSQDAIPFLRSPEMGSYLPDLIILDYRMPLDGGRALAELKGDPDYRHIPTVVLTGSSSPKDVCDIYRRGANCCYRKPPDLQSYETLVRLIAEHWLTRISSPTC
jgi:CheY-like chemotaxis protein